jgi:O-acetylhomoserine/O-acetylserine sulfhydrylase-like pyridoxal-dependent enzyme
MGSRADDLILLTVAIDDLDDLIADLDQTLQKV